MSRAWVAAGGGARFLRIAGLAGIAGEHIGDHADDVTYGPTHEHAECKSAGQGEPETVTHRVDQQQADQGKDA